MFDPQNPIRNPKLQDLTVAANVGLHLAYMRESVLTERTYEALLSSHFVRDWFKQHPEFDFITDPLYDQLRTALIDNSWIALGMIKEEAIVVELLDRHLLALFTLPERYEFSYPTDDLAERLLLEGMRGYLLNYMLFEDRNRIKRNLKEVLERSTTVVTAAPFFMAIRQGQPTLANWFEAYKLYMGSAIESPERRHKFLTLSENGKVLTPVERRRLELVLILHQRFSLSSFNQFGMEEEFTYADGDESGIFLYGEQEKHDQQVVKNINELIGTPADAIAVRPAVSHVSAKLNPNFDVTGPDVDAIKGPDHFTDEDSKEIASHSSANLNATGKSDEEYLKLAEDVQAEAALTFKTPQDEKRFNDLVVSVLRGLRDTMELKQYLVDLSFPSAEGDVVVATVEAKLGKHKPLIRKPVEDKLASKPTLQQLQKKLAPMNDAQASPQATMQVEPPVTKNAPAPRKAFLPKLRRSRAVKRPLVDDVRLQPSMVMGPIDELRAMDTLEFRRLSPDPTSAARRLKDKIELLAEESITKQAEGIEAFKQSPLNTLYLELGNDSIASGKSVSTVIAERQAAGTPSLSEVEFNAISDLNKLIRF